MKNQPREPHVLDCDPLELGWAAGLFEGEGNISVQRRTAGGKQGYGPYVALTIAMTDRDVIDHFCAVVGCGAVHVYARPRPAHHKQVYTWQAASAQEVLAVLEALEPLLGNRRRARAREAIVAIRAAREATCVRCDGAFFASNTRQIYCSEECYTARKREDEAARIRDRRRVGGQLRIGMT